MRLTIDRRTWIRGDDGPSYLLRNEDLKMCCLGFLALAEGMLPCQIRDVALPSCISVGEFASTRTAIFKVASDRKDILSNRDLEDVLTDINDDPELTETEREAKLAAAFREHLGIELEFIN